MSKQIIIRNQKHTEFITVQSDDELSTIISDIQRILEERKGYLSIKKKLIVECYPYEFLANSIIYLPIID